jgi:hypothetical protein
MRFGLFGSAQADGSDLGAGIGQGLHDYIDFNVHASVQVLQRIENDSESDR